MDNESTHTKDSLQILLSAFLSICVLIAVGYLVDFFMENEAVTADVYKMLCVPAGEIKPEPVERAIYLTSVFLLPFLVWGFNLYFSRSFAEFKGKIDRIINVKGASVVLMILIGLLGWTGLERVHYLYLTGNFYYDNFLLSLPIFFAIFIGFLKFNLGEREGKRYKLVIIGTDIVYFSFLMLIFAVNVFDMSSIIGEKSLVNYEHLNSVFYPVTQVYMGKGLLVDFNNLYGLYPQFLEPIFKMIGLNVLKFSIVMSLLAALSFGLIFMFFRKSIDNWMIRFLGISSFMYFTYFIGNSISVHPDPYFQYVPIRFLFPMLFIYLSFCYFQNNSQKIYYTMPVVCSLAYLWNIETGILVYFTWLITITFIELFNADYKAGVKNIGKHIGFSVLSLIIVIFTYALYSFVRYGDIPNFNLEYQKIFYTFGYFMLPMPLIHPWNLVAITYIIGLSYCSWALLHKKLDLRVKVIFMLSVLGVGIFSYYQGRSHDMGLIGIWYPAVILAVLYADSLYKRITNKQYSYVTMGVFGLLIYIFSSSIFSLILLSDNNYGTIQSAMAQISSRESNYMRDNVKLIRRHTKPREEILILSYTSGAYFAESQTMSDLDISSFNEMFLRKDLVMVEDVIEEKKVDKVFYDLTFLQMGTTEEHTKIIKELEEHYRIEDSNQWMRYYVPQ